MADSIRRSARRRAECNTALPAPLSTAYKLTEDFAKEYGLKFLVMSVPFEPDIHDHNVHGLALRLRRNRSCIKTKKNVNPEPYSKQLDPIALDNGEERIARLVHSIKGRNYDSRPGILVLLIQPSSSLDEEQQDPQSDDLGKPASGVLIRIGTAPTAAYSEQLLHSSLNPSSFADDSESFRSIPTSLDDIDQCERSISAVFCRRSIPTEIVSDILRVTMIRALIDAFCYEESAQFLYGSSSATTSDFYNEHGGELPPFHSLDKRFASFHINDFALCPAAVTDVVIKVRLRTKTISQDLPFTKHYDLEDGTPYRHERFNSKCGCLKKKEIETDKEFYGFYMLTWSLMKSFIDHEIEQIMTMAFTNAMKFYKAGSATKHKASQEEYCSDTEVPRKKRQIVAAV